MNYYMVEMLNLLTFSPPASRRRDLQHATFRGGITPISQIFSIKSHSMRKI
jgi:hypothetical protein